MPSRNLEWYNLNCTRPYPLDDQATLVDVNGDRLDHHLIADLNLKIPRTAGRYVHLGGISLGKNLATATFIASEDAFGTENLVPVAAVMAVNPEKYVHYAVEALYPGVGGWVVWGTGVDENELKVHKFMSGREALLLPRTATFYQPLPIETMGKLYGASLTGLIHLSGGTDIEVVKECLNLDTFPPERLALQCGDDVPYGRECVVIRLKETQDEGIVTLPEDVARQFAAQQNIYNRFSGLCGGRPESNTCGNPEPIETINAVEPNCCGQITIRFTGCAKLTNVTQEVILDDLDEEVSVDSACGVVVDCGLDMTEACPEDTIPEIDGTRRWELDTLCVSESLSTSVAGPCDDTPATDPGSDPGGLPFTEDFYSPIDGSWEITQGWWGGRVYLEKDVGGDVPDSGVMGGYFQTIGNLSRQCWGTWAENCFAVRNNLIWIGDVGTYWREVRTILVPVVDDAGANYPRCGIVFNYRETETSSGIFEWWSLEVTRNHYHIVHFDGYAEHIIFSGLGPVIEQNRDAQLSLGIYPECYEAGVPTGAVLYVKLVIQPAWGGEAIVQELNPIHITNFAPDTGNFGITAKNCHVAVHDFEVSYSATPDYPPFP